MRLACLFFLLVPSVVPAQELQCPARVSVNQSVQNSPPGWSVSYDALGHPLAAVTFYDGRPEDRASLVNDSESKTKTQSVAVWRFLPGAERQVWLACQYSGTSAMLSKALPVQTKECSVTYSLRETISGFPVIQKIECR